ncbi:MAG: carbonic anhydrase [Bacteroidales bacterium]|nr:MAG: carbonic anhydrase [Paludibacter sp.]MCE1156463.1 carbonic anhydrase [Bacteroidales bacterium]OJX83742.1 MAG: carbonic anhydrase [Paludibacter sp. 47-17]
MWAHTKELQDRITPQEALDYLIEGNRRFVNNLNTNRNLLKQVNLTSEEQFPFAAILSCIDSRTSAELIFDQGLGDIFSIRIAGNVLNDDILGSMEYACAIAHSKIIVVLGHTRCGAITSACNDLEFGYLTGLVQKIKIPINLETTVTHMRTGGNPDFVNKVSELNVHHTVKLIREKSTIISRLEQEGAILLIGGMYDLTSGKVNFFDVPY